LLQLHWGWVPTRVIAHPPSFKGLIRAFRRVREKRGNEESETSGFRLKPKLGYELPAEGLVIQFTLIVLPKKV
jgi:hypothetical protein